MAIADRVMREMGGYDAWQKTRYFARGFFGGQYQIWDKHTGDFHWEKDTLVANHNLNSKQGCVYSRGRDISASPAGQNVLAKVTPTWVNNSYWLLMPFKLKDSGVTLTYKGAGKTVAGAAADSLQMTFKNVGLTPQHRYEVLVNRATDSQPAFRCHWNEYAQRGSLLLAVGRGDAAKPGRLDNLALVPTLPVAKLW